jgi:hypothetical protein
LSSSPQSRQPQDIYTYPHPDPQTGRLHRARSALLTDHKLVELRAIQRTFEGAYIRTSLSSFSFALVVLKIFTAEFYGIGALFAKYGAGVLAVGGYMACESAPERLLITGEDRQHLAEAKRVQTRVLELSAAIDPAKTDIVCRDALIQGLISMAKISFRCGEDRTGDERLEAASRLANSMNSSLYKEVIQRIDKDPAKTAMKHWEPVSAEECKRLIALDEEALEKHRNKAGDTAL